MATVIKRDLVLEPGAEITIIPVGDVHIGAAACDEELFKAVIDRIAADNLTYWFGMGDYCDFINSKDPRFSVTSLADWLVSKSGLGDIVKAQRDYFLDLIKPIASKCLALVEGNHETSIWRHYERAIYGEIVTAVKDFAGHPADYSLGIGYYGWFLLNSFQSAKASRKRPLHQIKFSLHHGFTGGRLAGAKALNMQRWLWSHACDVALFGHSHNIMAQVESVECLDGAGNIGQHVRRGAFSGTFLRSIGENHSTYSEVKGYLPLPLGGCEIKLRPFDVEQRNRIRIVT